MANYETAPFEKRVATLREFSRFEDDGAAFEFTYDLGRRDLNMDLIERFGLDAVVDGLEDVELMFALLKWVNDNFKHDGMSAMPTKRSATTIIEYMEQHDNGINCRGLSILFAELLRLYGIPAKHITCHSDSDDFYVHVVTHAFSKKLDQWIMIDASSGLYLKDEQGNIMNLYNMRRAMIEGKPLFASNHAYINSLEGYITFMTDYLFRFSCAKDFYVGSEDRGGEMPPDIMLVPVNYTQSASDNIITTSAEAFFARP